MLFGSLLLSHQRLSETGQNTCYRTGQIMCYRTGQIMCYKTGQFMCC